MKTHSRFPRRLVAFVVALTLVAALRAQPGRPGNPPAPAQPPRGSPPPVPLAPPSAPPVPVTPAPAPVAPPNNTVGLGTALAGLTVAQLADFAEGRAAFRERETPATGLGPIFNDNSCIACHDAGGIGGASRRTVTRFGRTENGVFDPLESQGGSLLQDRAIDPAGRERVPAQANTIALRVTTPVFGTGLIEAIADATIVLGTTRVKPAGIAGKVSVVRDVVSGQNRIGRFGWKAQQATLLAFTGDAYLNEMGITNRFFPTENAPNGNTALLARFDRVPGIEDPVDPADGRADVDRLADFMRLLAPPARRAMNASAQAGERLFSTLDCAACHTPAMTTGRHAIAALSEKTVALYSDLLLHDMGVLGDGIAHGTAGPREMRTAPLWGLRSRPVWLHDGRATTIETAIRAHDGEAAGSRDKFIRLGDAERRQLLDFLNTL